MSTPKKPTTTKKTSKKVVVKPQVVDDKFPTVEFDDNVDAELRKKINAILRTPDVRKAIKEGCLDDASKIITKTLDTINVNITVEEAEDKEDAIYIMRTYLAATILATRWEYELGQLVRKVRKYDAWSSDDFANEPEKSKKVEENLKKRIIKNGWFLSDEDASVAADQRIECDLDQYAHDLMYRKACSECIARKVREAAENLRILRNWCMMCDDMSAEIKDAGGKIPKVFPDLEKYHLEDGKFVRNEPEIEFEKLNVSPEKKKALTDLLTSITEDNKKKD